MQFNFKKENSVKSRKEQFKCLIKRNSNQIPVILERAKDCNINKIIKTKYLLPKELNLAEFMKIIRKKLELDNSIAIYFLVNGTHVLSGCEELSEIYEKFKDKEDGFLYIVYANQVFFG